MNGLSKQLKGIAEGLIKTLGSNYEIVIHDFSSLDASVIHVSGNVTGRKVGAPVTDILLKLIRNKETHKDVINLRINLKDGRVLKSSSIFIHDEQGEAIGCVSINIDITEMLHIGNVINDITSFEDEGSNEGVFNNEINQVFEKVIKKCIDEHVKPVSYMSKEDKLEVIKNLDQNGVFLVKGGVERVAEELGISRFTLYNYINEIKN